MSSYYDQVKAFADEVEENDARLVFADFLNDNNQPHLEGVMRGYQSYRQFMSHLDETIPDIFDQVNSLLGSQFSTRCELRDIDNVDGARLTGVALFFYVVSEQGPPMDACEDLFAAFGAELYPRRRRTGVYNQLP